LAAKCWHWVLHFRSLEKYTPRSLPAAQNYHKDEISEMLDLIELRDKKNCTSKTLSRGMKRKLPVAVEFIGGSKVVVLDEQSSGKHDKDELYKTSFSITMVFYPIYVCLSVLN